jgi:hypothetical protein
VDRRSGRICERRSRAPAARSRACPRYGEIKAPEPEPRPGSERASSACTRFSRENEEETGKADLYRNGVITYSYILAGDLERPTPQRLLDVLEQVKGTETSWPTWLVFRGRDAMSPRPVQGPSRPSSSTTSSRIRPTRTSGERHRMVGCSCFAGTRKIRSRRAGAGNDV